MSEANEPLVRRQIRSPRSAAAAGIIFSLLIITIMVLTTNIARASLEDINSDWLETWSGTASLVLGLVPFAGIAFLWFTGVIRDLVGDREDRFFATIFFGSGIIFMVMTFVWAATMGAIFSSFAVANIGSLGDDVFIFGFAFMNEVLGNYALRMAGVYMFSIATLWSKTDVVPRWLIIVTYVVAVGFLFFSGSTREARFVFPVWVLVVSVYILILNYRRSSEEPIEA